jgi:hypothetical protein
VSGVRRFFRWAPPYLAFSAVALAPIALVLAALAGYRESLWLAIAASVLGSVPILSSGLLFVACGEWRRAAKLERAVHMPVRARQPHAQQGWFGQVHNADGWIR